LFMFFTRRRGSASALDRFLMLGNNPDENRIDTIYHQRHLVATMS